MALTQFWLLADCLATAITWMVISKQEDELSISGNYWVKLD
jgi:hypothetical protein